MIIKNRDVMDYLALIGVDIDILRNASNLDRSLSLERNIEHPYHCEGYRAAAVNYHFLDQGQPPEMIDVLPYDYSYNDFALVSLRFYDPSSEEKNDRFSLIAAQHLMVGDTPVMAVIDQYFIFDEEDENNALFPLRNGVGMTFYIQPSYDDVRAILTDLAVAMLTRIAEFGESRYGDFIKVIRQVTRLGLDEQNIINRFMSVDSDRSMNDLQVLAMIFMGNGLRLSSENKPELRLDGIAQIHYNVEAHDKKIGLHVMDNVGNKLLYEGGCDVKLLEASAKGIGHSKFQLPENTDKLDLLIVTIESDILNGILPTSGMLPSHYYQSQTDLINVNDTTLKLEKTP